jgi:SWIM/SEC-C metal-binding protein
MSKFFFMGKLDIMGKNNSNGFAPKRTAKPGTELYPLTLIVNSVERQSEIEAILEEHSLLASIEVKAEVPEDIRELDFALSKSTPQVFDKVLGPVDLSGLKFVQSRGDLIAA